MAFRRKQSNTRLDTAAQSIGRSLGHLAGRVDKIKRQRKAVAKEIRAAIGQAESMLADLGDDVEIAKRRARKGTRRVKRVVSAEARAKMAAAQKRRWAKVRRDAKKAKS